MSMLDDWQRGVDADRIIASLFLDLSRAFDTINHAYLLQKLELNFGVRGHEHNWFREYLQGRQQRVMIGSVVSTWLTLTHDVPQGSILGPLLFILFVNDLPTMVQNGSLNMYADNTTLYSEGNTVANAIGKLKEDAQLTLEWLKHNNLTVNLKKTKFMLAGRRRRDKEISMARFALCDEELQPQVVTTSLGVAIDSQLTWKERVKRVRQKCFVGLTKLRRIGRNVPMTTRKMLYSALILPHVDYCSVVYGNS